MKLIINKTNETTITFSDKTIEIECPEDSVTVLKSVVSLDDDKKEEQIIYTDMDEIIKMIYNDYMKNDVELSLQFFDFDVKATKGDLINAFIWLEYAINKFYVSLVNKPIYNESKTILYGSSSPNGMVPLRYINPLEFLSKSPYHVNEVYKGNYKDFLSTLKKEVHYYTGYDLIVYDNFSLSTSLSTILD